MGDHRSDSSDSRAHLGDPGGGMVPLEDVIGRVELIYWPPSRVGVLPRPTLGHYTSPAPAPSGERAAGTTGKRYT
jgi:signal peptidase I